MQSQSQIGMFRSLAKDVNDCECTVPEVIKCTRTLDGGMLLYVSTKSQQTKTAGSLVPMLDPGTRLTTYNMGYKCSFANNVDQHRSHMTDL